MWEDNAVFYFMVFLSVFKISKLIERLEKYNVVIACVTEEMIQACFFFLPGEDIQLCSVFTYMTMCFVIGINT